MEPLKVAYRNLGLRCLSSKGTNYSITSQITITDLGSDVIHCLCVTQNHTVFKYQIL
jgi:hypothetical protein